MKNLSELKSNLESYIALVDQEKEKIQKNGKAFFSLFIIFLSLLTIVTFFAIRPMDPEKDLLMTLLLILLLAFLVVFFSIKMMPRLKDESAQALSVKTVLRKYYDQTKLFHELNHLALQIPKFIKEKTNEMYFDGAKKYLAISFNDFQRVINLLLLALKNAKTRRFSYEMEVVDKLYTGLAIAEMEKFLKKIQNYLPKDTQLTETQANNLVLDHVQLINNLQGKIIPHLTDKFVKLRVTDKKDVSSNEWALFTNFIDLLIKVNKDKNNITLPLPNKTMTTGLEIKKLLDLGILYFQVDLSLVQKNYFAVEKYFLDLINKDIEYLEGERTDEHKDVYLENISSEMVPVLEKYLSSVNISLIECEKERYVGIINSPVLSTYINACPILVWEQLNI